MARLKRFRKLARQEKPLFEDADREPKASREDRFSCTFCAAIDS